MARSSSAHSGSSPRPSTKEQSDKATWHAQSRNGERESDEAILKRLIERHFKHTGSTRARNLLSLCKYQRALESRASSLEQKLEVSERSRALALRDSSEQLAQVMDLLEQWGED